MEHAEPSRRERSPGVVRARRSETGPATPPRGEWRCPEESTPGGSGLRHLSLKVHSSQDQLRAPPRARRIERARLADGLEPQPQVLVAGVVAEVALRTRAFDQCLERTGRRGAGLGDI